MIRCGFFVLVSQRAMKNFIAIDKGKMRVVHGGGQKYLTLGRDGPVAIPDDVDRFHGLNLAFWEDMMFSPSSRSPKIMRRFMIAIEFSVSNIFL